MVISSKSVTFSMLIKLGTLVQRETLLLHRTHLKT